jgi:zinc and cadmium transporter
MNITVLSIIAVIITSAISLVGIFALFISEKTLRPYLFFLVSVSAGALFGDAFIHLIPDALREADTGNLAPFYILFGIFFFFALEKFLHWHHHHEDESAEHDAHIHPVGPMVLIADLIHNFIDGVLIAASFLVSVPVGVATTVAVVLHEIPHEIGNVALLLHAGFTKKRAVLFNCYAALTSLVGAVLFVYGAGAIVNLSQIMIPFAAGGFIYIAGSDLVPELHKDVGVEKALIQSLGMVLGVLIMVALLFVE